MKELRGGVSQERVNIYNSNDTHYTIVLFDLRKFDEEIVTSRQKEDDDKISAVSIGFCKIK